MVHRKWNSDAGVCVPFLHYSFLKVDIFPIFHPDYPGVCLCHTSPVFLSLFIRSCSGMRTHSSFRVKTCEKFSVGVAEHEFHSWKLKSMEDFFFPFLLHLPFTPFAYISFDFSIQTTVAIGMHYLQQVPVLLEQ